MADTNSSATAISAKDLQYRSGSQGWKQFQQNKIDMLQQYDSAKSRSAFHKAPTHHGNVGEALVRSWLESFLPAKYGVTPGYVISQFEEDGAKLPHFDVIIYDRLESPVLWVDKNPDSTRQGTSRAIPAEYVLGVLEVKSRWTPKSAKDAIRHLQELGPYMAAEDPTDARFKKYLPKQFFCGLVFFELMTEDASKPSLLDSVNDTCLKGYLGSIVLRGEELDQSLTGKLKLVGTAAGPRKSEVTRGSTALLKPNTMPGSASVPLRDGTHRYVGLTWTGANFADWAFDILALLKGTYVPGRVSSHYAATWRTHKKPS